MEPIGIRAYVEADFSNVAALWTRVNRELAPPEMRESFEKYIAMAIDGELKHLLDVFSEARRSAFWVVETGGQIVGTFGIESRGQDSTELRRMYLDLPARGQGIARLMLQCAESRALQLGFSRIVLSTAEIQKAAIAFYKKNGFQFVRTETATAMTTATVGGGLARLHFEKRL